MTIHVRVVLLCCIVDVGGVVGVVGGGGVVDCVYDVDVVVTCDGVGVGVVVVDVVVMG